MPTAELVDNHILIEDIRYRDRDTVKELPGYSYKGNVTRCAVSWPALKVLVDLFPDTLDIGPELRDWAWNESTERVVPATEAHDWAMDPRNDADGNEDLYPYQRTGAQFMLEAFDGAALTDDMGTGKTAQVIEVLEQELLYPALIVGPKSARSGWRREFVKWAPWRDVCFVTGTAVQRRKQLEEVHEAYVITWDNLRAHSRLAPYGSIALTKDEKTPKELNAIEWKAVVADEAHRAVDPKAKQTRALWAVSKDASYRAAMTGTPVVNSPADFWSILRFVAPHEWPSRSKYIDRYCLQMYNTAGYLDVTGLQPYHKEEFHALIKTRHLRRPKELVLPWLPPKVYETRDVEMTAAQKKVYKQLQKEVIADVEGGTVLALDPLSLLTRLTQAACATLSIDSDGKVVLQAPSNKVDDLVALLEDMGNDPLVVFAQSRQLIELAATRLTKEKITYSKIVGGQSDLAREAEEDMFHSGESRVILLTLGAGSEALTLTEASTVYFMQRSWSLVQNKQAEDRVSRPGQTADKVLIIDAVAPDTVEESQWDVYQGKSGMLEEITQDRQALVRAIRGRGR
jgi:SNF2 family DNA or RNA helicase